MPEKNFYINDMERKELFDFIKHYGASIIPDLKYKDKSYIEIEESNVFLKYINEKINPLYFIASEKYTKEPLAFLELSNTKEYTIRQTEGGPTIMLGLFTTAAAGAKIKYKRTWLSYHTDYIHYNSYEVFSAPQELKDFFNNIVEFLNKKCKIVTVSGKKYRVSKEVLKDLKL